MKKLFLSIAQVLLFASTTLISANELKSKTSFQGTNQELTTLLTPESPVEELEHDVTIVVKIRITANNEIIVLKTNSNNLELNDYIIEKLNHKKLFSNELAKENYYEFKINFTS
jgi:hypothetical protein